MQKLAKENPDQVEVVQDAIAKIENPLAQAVAALLKNLADKGKNSEDAPQKASRALNHLIQARIWDRAVRLLFRELCKEFCE